MRKHNAEYAEYYYSPSMKYGLGICNINYIKICHTHRLSRQWK